jgi:hypothetical protein
MDFVLRYRGPLASAGGPREKHQIRLAIHPQLKQLCALNEQFKLALEANLPEATLKGRRVEVQGEFFFFTVRVGDLSYVPLISRPHHLACSLDITFLRRESPGAIVQGGDLDNRIKTLFDALRMPHDPSEIPSGITGCDERMYCLLEDDSLITRVSVTTHRLLEPPSAGEEADVDLLMHVILQSTYPMWGNLGF